MSGQYQAPNQYGNNQFGGNVAPAYSSGNDGLATVVPYTNPPALFGYYLSVFSIIPGIGFFLGTIAIILGIIGLRRRSLNPKSKGSVHAVVAICLGGLTTFVNSLGISYLIAMIILSA